MEGRAPVLNRLKDKVCIITGAGQGIGRAAARRFTQEGAIVVIADFSTQAAERTFGDLQQMGSRGEMFVGDLMHWEGAQALVAFALKRLGRIDVLVNNIGGATDLKSFHLWEPGAIIEEMNRSILPTIYCSRAVLPHMIERRFGRIVNVGAESVRNGLWDRAPYNAGKGAVLGLTTSIAREYAQFGIVCNCFSPGPTDTRPDRIVARGIRVLQGQESEHLREMGRRTLEIVPMNRQATADEQAAGIAFLASDDVGVITGQTVSAGGGMNML
jgi:NAD(P)-dependent dehydrogenase (short-subunit alcohol dehydrogenase family)